MELPSPPSCSPLSHSMLPSLWRRPKRRFWPWRRFTWVLLPENISWPASSVTAPRAAITDCSRLVAGASPSARNGTPVPSSRATTRLKGLPALNWAPRVCKLIKADPALSPPAANCSSWPEAESCSDQPGPPWPVAAAGCSSRRSAAASSARGVMRVGSRSRMPLPWLASPGSARGTAAALSTICTAAASSSSRVTATPWRLTRAISSPR